MCLAVQLGLVFSHTENCPNEVPLLDVKSIRGIHVSDLTILKEKLEQEQRTGCLNTMGKMMELTMPNRMSYLDICGEPVTLETFMAWRKRFEAELALERAKLMPESALTAPKEKKLTGRQWFESGRTRRAVLTADQESEEEDDEDIYFDDEDFEDDEEDMLEHYLAEKSDASAPIARA
ncbi:BnaA06g02130D [Brassica napus]|uniref:RWD domain-containing protein n=3 Tax=Brassica TaxID=3705 RepID=M4DQY5_BRACM|nr:unnamed protein product [Brassica napus]CDY22864.1 BnaA06g02130D [Brassica napus]